MGGRLQVRSPANEKVVVPSSSSSLLLPKEASLLRQPLLGGPAVQAKGFKASPSIISLEIGTHPRAEATDFLIDLPVLALATASLGHH